MDYIIGGARGVKKPGLAAGPGTPAGAPDALIKDVGIESFAAEVLDASMQVPVLVDFWAPWCGPCKQLTPILEKLVKAAKGAVRMVKINIDENQEIARQLRIQSIPTVYLFKDGQPVDGFMGALPESEIKAFLAKWTGPAGPSPVAEVLEAAKAALAAGDIATAAQAYATILQEAPGEIAAVAGLARCYLAAGDLKRAEETLALTPPEGRTAPDIVSVQAMVSLAKEAGAAGDPAALKARLAENPMDHAARYDLAMALIARGDREGAVDSLMEILRADRKWNDEAARKKLLTLFEAFGADDPVTMAGRRKLSALLFS
jgi:putative thioredoxin